MAVNNHGYRFVEIWHRTGGSYDPYIQEQCDRALAEGAPLDVVYRINETRRVGDREQVEGTWITAEQIPDERLRRAFGLEPVPEACVSVTRTGEGETRVWAVGAVGNEHSRRHVLEAYGVSVSIERGADGRTLVRVDREGAEVQMDVAIEGLDADS